MLPEFNGYENYGSFLWCSTVSNDESLWNNFHSFMSDDPNDSDVRHFVRTLSIDYKPIAKELREWAAEYNENLLWAIDQISLTDVREEAVIE